MKFENAEVSVIKSKRKTISIQVKPNEVIIRAPIKMKQTEIEKFVESKRNWIEKHLQTFSEKQQHSCSTFRSQAVSSMSSSIPTIFGQHTSRLVSCFWLLCSMPSKTANSASPKPKIGRKIKKLPEHLLKFYIPSVNGGVTKPPLPKERAYLLKEPAPVLCEGRHNKSRHPFECRSNAEKRWYHGKYFRPLFYIKGVFLSIINTQKNIS